MIIDIVNSLNSRGFKSTKGVDFNKSRLHMMLKNRKYIGEYKYKDIIIPGGIPPIISEDIFKKVQQRMERNKHAPAKEKAKINYLLSTKLFCGKCGALMLGESGYGSKGNMYHYYKCANNKRRKTCDKKAVKKDWIEDLVIRLTKEMVLNDDIIERVADTIYNLQFKENTILKALRKSLSDVEASINNMLDAIQMGVVTSSTKQRLEELERRKSDIEVSIMNEEIEHPALSKENIIFWISRFKYLDMGIEENRQYLIDTFVNSIYLYDDKLVITYNIKDGTRTITLEELENSDLMQNGSPPKNRLNIAFKRFLFLKLMFIFKDISLLFIIL